MNNLCASVFFLSFLNHSLCFALIPFPPFKIISPQKHPLLLTKDLNTEQIFGVSQNNSQFQKQVDLIFSEPDLQRARQQNRLTFALLDYSKSNGSVTSIKTNPIFASVNPQTELYAASLPKIAILLGYMAYVAQQQNASSQTELLLQNENSIRQMINVSSNADASKIYRAATFERIKKNLLSHKLFDWNEETKSGTGGLWIGKPYEPGLNQDQEEDQKEGPGQVQVSEGGYEVGVYSNLLNSWPALDLYKDFNLQATPRFPSPVSSYVHASNSLQALRYLWLMERGQLLNPYMSQIIKAFMSQPISSFCAEEIKKQFPLAQLYSKTGLYNNWIAEVMEVKSEDHHFFFALLMYDVPEQLAQMQTACQKIAALINSSSYRN